MTAQEIRHLLKSETTLLAPHLFEGMASSISGANVRSGGLGHGKYPHLRSLIVRVLLREYLEAQDLPEGWILEGNPALMGQLYLSQPERGLKLRLLKERRRTYASGVPTAGRNPARQETWVQTCLNLLDVSQPRSELVEFLLLWDYRGTETEEFTLRVVHTVEAGQYGRAVKCDLDMEIQHGGTLFDSLRFEGNYEDTDLFQETEVEIDPAETSE